LRQLRYSIAQKAGVPPYIVFGDTSLIDMATRLPQNKEEFASIHGVGKAKLKKYVSDFLPIIKTYVAEHTKTIGRFQFDYGTPAFSGSPAKKKKTLLDKLFQERQKLADQEEVVPEEICSDQHLRNLQLNQPIEHKYIEPFVSKLRLQSNTQGEAFLRV